MGRRALGHNPARMPRHQRPLTLFDLDSVLVDSRAAISSRLCYALGAQWRLGTSLESLEQLIGPQWPI